MPCLTTRNATLHYTVPGQGPVALLMQEVGARRDVWRPQVEAPSGEFTCVTFENRGIGRSAATDALTILRRPSPSPRHAARRAGARIASVAYGRSLADAIPVWSSWNCMTRDTRPRSTLPLPSTHCWPRTGSRRATRTWSSGAGIAA